MNLKKQLCLHILTVSVALLVCWETTAKAANQESLSWPKIEATVIAHFEKLNGKQPQAIISRSQVESLWVVLNKAGWQVPDQGQLTKLVLPDENFLVQQMRGSAGRRFTKNVVVKYPDVYDRIDRIWRLPSGKVNMTGLISAPDALNTVRYMMTDQGSESWASLLGHKHNFAQPTGRIYTAEALLARLQPLFIETHKR